MSSVCFVWTYDAANRATSFSSVDGTATYGYDPTNQLTSGTYTTASGGHQPANESYSFTANGNRNMTGYSTGSDNLMSSDGTYNYTYDADGNRITRTQISNSYSTDYKTTYTWDYRNRLTDVENYDNNGVLKQHVHYVYDLFDHLIATELDPTGGGTYTQISHYVLDVSPELPAAGVPGTATAQPVLQFDGNGNLTDRYLEARDRIFAQGAVSSLTSPDTVTWDLVDELGSVRDVVDNSGNVVDHIVYSSFGQVAYESAPARAHFAGFTGGHVDPNTGLVNDYHRWYDPASGRWISQDPLGFGGRDAHLTRYVSNGPTGNTDNLGLTSVPIPPTPLPVPRWVAPCMWIVMRIAPAPPPVMTPAEQSAYITGMAQQINLMWLAIGEKNAQIFALRQRMQRDRLAEEQSIRELAEQVAEMDRTRKAYMERMTAMGISKETASDLLAKARALDLQMQERLRKEQKVGNQ